VAVCCCVLQCVAVCCSVLQCVAVCCSVSVLQCVADTHVCANYCWRACMWVCCYLCCIVLQCVALCCSVLQCVAVCCSVLQCVAGCCRHTGVRTNPIAGVHTRGNVMRGYICRIVCMCLSVCSTSQRIQIQQHTHTPSLTYTLPQPNVCHISISSQRGCTCFSRQKNNNSIWQGVKSGKITWSRNRISHLLESGKNTVQIP